MVFVIVSEQKMFVRSCFSNMSVKDKLNFIELKFCISNDTIKRVKRQPIEMEKIFVIIYLIRDLYTENT